MSTNQELIKTSDNTKIDSDLVSALHEEIRNLQNDIIKLEEEKYTIMIQWGKEDEENVRKLTKQIIRDVIVFLETQQY